MGIEALVAAAASLIGGYLARTGEHIADQVVGDVDEAVMGRLGRLYEEVKRRLSGNEFGRAALERVEADPVSDRRQGSLRDALVDAVESDPQFESALRQFLQEIRETGGDSVRIDDSGAVAIGGAVTVEGTYAAGRDLTIDRPPADA